MTTCILMQIKLCKMIQYQAIILTKSKIQFMRLKLFPMEKAIQHIIAKTTPKWRDRLGIRQKNQ